MEIEQHVKHNFILSSIIIEGDKSNLDSLRKEADRL